MPFPLISESRVSAGILWPPLKRFLEAVLTSADGSSHMSFSAPELPPKRRCLARV